MAEAKKPPYRRPHFPDRLLLVPIHVRDERVEKCRRCPNMDDTALCTVSEKPVYAIAIKRNYMCPLGQWSNYYGR